MITPIATPVPASSSRPGSRSDRAYPTSLRKSGRPDLPPAPGITDLEESVDARDLGDVDFLALRLAVCTTVFRNGCLRRRESWFVTNRPARLLSIALQRCGHLLNDEGMDMLASRYGLGVIPDATIMACRCHHCVVEACPGIGKRLGLSRIGSMFQDHSGLGAGADSRLANAPELWRASLTARRTAWKMSRGCAGRLDRRGAEALRWLGTLPLMACVEGRLRPLRVSHSEVDNPVKLWWS